MLKYIQVDIDDNQLYGKYAKKFQSEPHNA